MEITLNNNKSKITRIDPELMDKIRNHEYFNVRVRGAHWSLAYQKKQWDGYKKFITPTGFINTGLIPKLIDVMVEWGEDVDIIDNRSPIEPQNVPLRLEEFVPRPYQRDAVESLVNNEAHDLDFPRGLIDAATNAGKTIISAMIHRVYNSKTVLALSSKELYRDAKEEITKMLPGEVGWISADDGVEWNNFMIVMIPTIARNPNKYQLGDYRVVIVDECDLSGSKSYEKVLGKLYNAYVKVGLSGSINKSDDKVKNKHIESLYGGIIYQIGNRALIDLGFSSEVKVNILPGGNPKFDYEDGDKEYRGVVIYDEYRNHIIKRRVLTHIKNKNTPLLIMVKFHSHVDYLYEILKDEIPKGYNLDWVHHKRDGRFEIVKRFKEGNIDILIGSYILKRGKNFPLMRALIHAAGGKSVSTVLQVLGRATRKHESKPYTILDDFRDEGTYSTKHSKRRINTYIKEDLTVKFLKWRGKRKQGKRGKRI